MKWKIAQPERIARVFTTVASGVAATETGAAAAIGAGYRLESLVAGDTLSAPSTEAAMPKPRIRSAVIAMLIATALAWVPGTARASWPNGKLVQVGYLSQWGLGEGYLMPGASPNEFFILYIGAGPLGLGWWQLHKFSTEGVGLWPGFARDLSSRLDSYYGFGFASDGTGGFLSLYANTNSGVFGERVDAAGTVVPPWLIDSPVNAQSTTIAGVSADGGGAYFVWNHNPGLRMTRVDTAGARLPNWPAGGWRLSPTTSFYNPPALAADGSGGVFVLWVNDRPRAIHVSGDTTVSPGWPAEGLPLQSITEFAFSKRLVRSDETSFVAVWLGFPSGPRRLMCQRFSTDGHVEAGWPADGVQIRTNINASDWKDYLFRCMPDGAGGLTATWGENGIIYARHVLKDGSFPPGYASGARAVLDIRPMLGRLQKNAAVMPSQNGGLAVFYVDSTFSIRGRWFDANGDPDSGTWPFDAVMAYGPDLRAEGHIPIQTCAALPDGSGGAFVLLEAAVPENYPNAFVTHLVLAPWAGADRRDPASIALAASPNPSSRSLTLRFTLPTSAPARLELLDLAGRRLRALEVTGAGNHVERLEDLAALPPGVYLVRIAQGDRERLTRVAIVH